MARHSTERLFIGGSCAMNPVCSLGGSGLNILKYSNTYTLAGEG